jgi:hypothetical protein
VRGSVEAPTGFQLRFGKKEYGIPDPEVPSEMRNVRGRRLREVIVSPFRVVYRVDPGRVRVIRAWRSERLLEVPEESL